MNLTVVEIGALAGLAAAVALAPEARTASSWACVPTRAHHQNEAQNPNYKPGAPVRSSVGKGHVLVGVVRSAADCRPIARARLELFEAGPRGYSNGATSWAGRATVFTRRDGSYRFESPFPTRYYGRPHIHMRVSARGFIPLSVTYFPKIGEKRGRFDLVLVPGPSRHVEVTRACSAGATKTPSDGGPPAIPARAFFNPHSPQRSNLRGPTITGVALTLRGHVYDQECQPVARALLDFFQADSHGNYDRMEVRLHGHQFTDARGGYVLRTIVPSRYRGRTPHIHVKVQAPHGPILETQLYFPAGLRAYGMNVGALNAHDRFFKPATTVRLGARHGNHYAASFDFVIATG